MISVIYYKRDTGEAYQLLSGHDLSGFPDPPPDSLALLLTDSVSLPGYVDGTAFVPLPASPSEPYRFNWTTKQWEDPRTLSEVKNTTLSAIDDFAGKARLRYITSVPGQAETYAKKEEQARQWATSGFTGNAPSFIAAEATALNRDPISVAQEIIGLADIWGNHKGPEIEACRRKWKVSVENALSNEEINVLLSQAKNELSTL